MYQSLQHVKIDTIKIRESNNIEEIIEAFESKFYVQNVRLKPKIIKELSKYLKLKFADSKYKIKVFIAYNNMEICGFVITQIDPYYSSYSRKCGTFGWLNAKNFNVCKKLINSCENFVKENKIRKIRGNINFPKNLGGIGIQYSGFNQQMLYGVAYNDPNSQILDYLEDLGYFKESQYSCVYVAQKSWNKGIKIDKNIKFRYKPLDEIYNLVDDIRALANNSFYEILPDASGRNRIYEFFETFKKIPRSWYRIQNGFNPKTYSDIPHFIEAWESCELENIEPLAPMAFNRKTGELVGILLGLPDLYESWLGDPITRVNVDTAMVKKGYFGRGIFSALNNLGQLTANLFGINYFEGTAIWSNNSRAIDTIFPHCTPIRKHYVMQKRV